MQGHSVLCKPFSVSVFVLLMSPVVDSTPNARTATRRVDEWDPLYSSSVLVAVLVAVLVDRFLVFITFDSTVFGYLSLICSSTPKKARGTMDYTDGTDTKRNQPRITSVRSTGGWPVF